MYIYTYTYTYTYTSRRGENCASVLNVVFFKCRFRHSETTDSFPNVSLKFPGKFEVLF